MVSVLSAIYNNKQLGDSYYFHTDLKNSWLVWSINVSILYDTLPTVFPILILYWCVFCICRLCSNSWWSCIKEWKIVCKVLFYFRRKENCEELFFAHITYEHLTWCPGMFSRKGIIHWYCLLFFRWHETDFLFATRMYYTFS